jgi:hypothetical protein
MGAPVLDPAPVARIGGVSRMRMPGRPRLLRAPSIKVAAAGAKSQRRPSVGETRRAVPREWPTSQMPRVERAQHHCVVRPAKNNFR